MAPEEEDPVEEERERKGMEASEEVKERLVDRVWGRRARAVEKGGGKETNHRSRSTFQREESGELEVEKEHVGLGKREMKVKWIRRRRVSERDDM